MDRELFEGYVEEALAQLPEEFKKVLKNLVVVIENEPNEEQKKLLILPRYMTLYGLYQGVPKTAWGSDTALLPSRITIFKNVIERSFHTASEIKEQVRRTVLHEIGHYLGMSEEELRKLKKI